MQDEEICLLEPDISTIYGVYESNDISTPDTPSLILNNLTGPTGKQQTFYLVKSLLEKKQIYRNLCRKINDLKVGLVI